jgi:type VI protein secretion system component Hcp
LGSASKEGIEMAFSAFLSLVGVVGASQDPNYPKQIEVLSFSFDGLKENDMRFAKRQDIASTVLFSKCASGEMIPSGTLALVKDSTPYIKYNMTEIFVTSIQIGGSSGAGGVEPVESVGLHYKKIDKAYTPHP